MVRTIGDKYFLENSYNQQQPDERVTAEQVRSFKYLEAIISCFSQGDILRVFIRHKQVDQAENSDCQTKLLCHVPSWLSVRQ